MNISKFSYKILCKYLFHKSPMGVLVHSKGEVVVPEPNGCVKISRGGGGEREGVPTYLGINIIKLANPL